MALNEATLRDFFQGKASAIQLAAEAGNATKQVTAQSYYTYIVDLEGDEEFIVDRSMLVQLCDAVLSGDLPAKCLEPIGFALVCSEHLHWAEEEDLVPRILYAWASPEINWELTSESVEMFRGWLTGHIEPPPEPKPDAGLVKARVARRAEKARKRAKGARRDDA